MQFAKHFDCWMHSRRDIVKRWNGSQFRHHIDADAVAGIRLVVSRSAPPGNARFLDAIERMRGQQREPEPRGRPSKERSRDELTVGQHALNFQRNK